MARSTPAAGPARATLHWGVLVPLVLAGLGLFLVAAALAAPSGHGGYPPASSPAGAEQPAQTRVGAPHATHHVVLLGAPGQARGPARRLGPGRTGDLRRQLLLQAMAPRMTPAAARALLEDWDRASGYSEVEAGRVARAAGQP